jgi:hypothetical protein
MGMERFPSTWPALELGAVRLAMSWPAVERSPGIYDWRGSDARVAASEGHGVKPMVTIVGTPRFHALGPGPITAASPPDLGAYRAFVRALVGRYGNRVDYQVWNEPNVLLFYTGTKQHMAWMTRIVGETVEELAPDAAVVAPSFPLRYNRAWAKHYWDQRPGGRKVGDFVDAASLSAYPRIHEGPERGLGLVRWMQRVLDGVDFDGPLWATELNYGANGGPPTAPIPMRTQVSFVVRTYVLHSTLGADRVYWYSWAPDDTVNTHLQDGHGALTPAGTAYGVVRDWILGTRPAGCSITRGVTTCQFRVGGGVRRDISWTRSERIRSLVVPDGARRRVDPAGVETAVASGERIRVGVTPVMIEVRRPG